MTTDSAFISQRQAKKRLHAETGETLVECAAIVARMPKQKIGLRLKVHRDHVAAAITEHSRPPVVEAKRTVKPLSDRHKQVFRATAETERIVRSLRQRATA